MRLQRDDRRERIARAKWTEWTVYIPSQEPHWEDDLEATRRNAKEHGGLRVKVERRGIRVGGNYIRTVVVLVGPKKPPVSVTVVVKGIAFEFLSNGPTDKAKKASYLDRLGQTRKDLLTVKGRRNWPEWLLAVGQ